jgi:hypothetical protein
VEGDRLTAAARGLLAALLTVAALPAVAAAPAHAARPPVVLLILDELPGDALLDSQRRIDSVRYPGFAQLRRSSTWFPNAHTVFDDTRQAVPLILDGRRPRRGGSRSRADHPRTIFDLFGRRGYRVVAAEEATALCPPRWCPGAAARDPDTIRNLRAGRAHRLRAFVSKVARSARPTLYVKHALLPHVPYMFLPSGRRTRNGVRDPIPGMNSLRGYGDPFLTRHNEQRFLLQLGFVDHVVGMLIRRLRRLGMFDRALIVVTADHGESFELGVRDRRQITRGNIDEVAPVPLFVKAPGQRRGRVNRAYARTLDVLPTIADVLGLRIPFRVDGGSAFGPAARRRRSVRIPRRDFSRTVSISARSWERRRRAVVRRRLSRFGEGRLVSLYTGIGPHRELIGERLAELRPAPRGRARARFVFGGRLRRVRRRTGLMPAHLAGTIAGGARRARRDLVLSVNGRIEVTGRSWRLRGSRAERFALNVPEAVLREGRNDVRLLERGRDGRLRLLGRA